MTLGNSSVVYFQTQLSLMDELVFAHFQAFLWVTPHARWVHHFSSVPFLAQCEVPTLPFPEFWVDQCPDQNLRCNDLCNGCLQVSHMIHTNSFFFLAKFACPGAHCFIFCICLTWCVHIANSCSDVNLLIRCLDFIIFHQFHLFQAPFQLLLLDWPLCSPLASWHLPSLSSEIPPCHSCLSVLFLECCGFFLGLLPSLGEEYPSVAAPWESVPRR